MLSACSQSMNPSTSYESASFLSILCYIQRSLLCLHLVQSFGKQDISNHFALLGKHCLCSPQDTILCLPSYHLFTQVSLHWPLLSPDLRCRGSSHVAVGLLCHLSSSHLLHGFKYHLFVDYAYIFISFFHSKCKNPTAP